MPRSGFRPLALLSAIGLACGTAAAALAADVAAGPWEIGPVIRGRNHSEGMPAAPTPAGRGWRFDFPAPGGSVHYVTTRTGPLEGARRMIVRYRVSAAPGARFVPEQQPEMPGTVSLAFQRSGDTWKMRGAYSYYRWYAPDATVREIAPGTGEISVSLDDPGWVSVNGQPSGQNRDAFADALRNADNVSLVFGSRHARGHGVHADAPARFELLSFRIE